VSEAGSLRGTPRDRVVFRSIEDDEGLRCVDLFRRPDETFGFDEFRRDVEERLWRPLHVYGERVFTTAEEALAAARHTVPWLPEPAP
jgi:hypothetical protein